MVLQRVEYTVARARFGRSSPFVERKFIAPSFFPPPCDRRISFSSVVDQPRALYLRRTTTFFLPPSLCVKDEKVGFSRCSLSIRDRRDIHSLPPPPNKLCCCSLSASPKKRPKKPDGLLFAEVHGRKEEICSRQRYIEDGPPPPFPPLGQALNRAPFFRRPGDDGAVKDKRN